MSLISIDARTEDEKAFDSWIVSRVDQIDWFEPIICHEMFRDEWREDNEESGRVSQAKENEGAW